ncbi:MAG: channel protein TolC, partial [Rhizobiales bacterium]|nr:channel protein TolC [Rhizobacter sp.]
MEKPKMSSSHRHPTLRPRALAVVLAIGLGLGGVARVQAQSLQELYQTARGYDASYLATRASVEAAQYRYDQARGLRLPQIGLG